MYRCIRALIYVCVHSLALLKFDVIILVPLGSDPLFLLLGSVVLQAAHAPHQAHRVHYHRYGYRLHLRLRVIVEVTCDPLIAGPDQIDQNAEKGEGKHYHAGTVVPAAFHYWVHLFTLSSR